MPSLLPEDAVCAAGRSPSPAGQAVYVYAFVDMTMADRLPLSPDQAVSVHPVGEAGALIREVPLAEFCGLEGEQNLADPAWIMPRICHHAAVVEGAMRVSPVFPAAFATLYLGLDSLTDFMRQHHAAITGFLRRVAGQEEWALKLTAELDDASTLDALATGLWPEWSTCSPGLRYLRSRQERPRLLEAARDAVARTMHGIVAGVRPLATAIRPFVRAAGAGASGHAHVEEYALLSPAGRGGILADRLGELAGDNCGPGVRFALSGPWPPYSFRPSLDGGGRRPDQ
jgi:hypothetical protein